MFLIRSKIKKIQLAFISRLLENSRSVDWQKVSRQIEGGKADFVSEVRKSLGRKVKKQSKEVDELLDKSWEEIHLFVESCQNQNLIGPGHGVSAAEIKKILEEVLSTTQNRVQSTPSSNETGVVSDEVPPVISQQNADSFVVPSVLDPNAMVLFQGGVEDLGETGALGEVGALGEKEENEEAIGKNSVLGDTETIGASFAEMKPLNEIGEIDEVEKRSHSDKTALFNEAGFDEIKPLGDVSSFVEAEIPAQTEENSEIGKPSEVKVPDAEADAFSDMELFWDEDLFDEIESPDDAEALGEAVPSDKAEQLDDVSSHGESEVPTQTKSPENAQEISDAKKSGETGKVREIVPPNKAVSFDVDGAPDVDAESIDTLDGNGTPDAEADIFDVELLLDDDLFDETEPKAYSDDDILAEELRLGVAETDVEENQGIDEEEEAIVFEPFAPDFGDVGELEPTENACTFALAAFGMPTYIGTIGCDREDEAIIETQGIFSIAGNLETSKIAIDMKFKELVDSVLAI